MGGVKRGKGKVLAILRVLVAFGRLRAIVCNVGGGGGVLCVSMPYTGIVLTFIALHAAAFLILLGHWLVSAGMFPRATERFKSVYDARPIRAVLVGVFTYGPLMVLFLSNGKIPNPLFKGLALILGLLALLIGLVGSAGLALRIGRNLSPDTSVWQQGLRGGMMLALVFITPFLGSLFLLHVGLASGFGAFLLAKPWKAAKAESQGAQEPSVLPSATVSPMSPLTGVSPMPGMPNLPGLGASGAMPMAARSGDAAMVQGFGGSLAASTLTPPPLP